MGIYNRCTAALLILLISFSVHSATRYPSRHDAKSVIDNHLTAAFQTPNGAIRYYGAEKYYALDNSLNWNSTSRLAPVVRPVTSTVGVPSFPYGGGAVMQASPIIAVQPSKTVPPSRIITGAKNLLRSSPQAIAGSAAFSAVIATAGWAIDELSSQVTKPGDTTYLGIPAYNAPNPTASPTHCTFAASKPKPSVWRYGGVNNLIFYGPTPASIPSGFTYINNCNTVHVATKSIPLSFTFDQSEPVPVTTADIDNLDLTGLSIEFYTGLLRDTCAASSNPTGCYEEMVDQSFLDGPTTVQGPSRRNTTTSLNPDGTTSTTTTTTDTQHDITYGSDYFDIASRDTTTVEVDGELVSTTVSEDTSTPQDPPPEQQEESYTFTNTPLPEVTPFYEPKYPDGFSGVWSSTSQQIDDSEFMTFLGSFVPSFSGSCPSFSMNFNIASWASYGIQNFPSLCYIFDIIKIILLITALFTSRAIIFGG